MHACMYICVVWCAEYIIQGGMWELYSFSALNSVSMNVKQVCYMYNTEHWEHGDQGVHCEHGEQREQRSHQLCIVWCSFPLLPHLNFPRDFSPPSYRSLSKDISILMLGDDFSSNSQDSFDLQSELSLQTQRKTTYVWDHLCFIKACWSHAYTCVRRTRDCVFLTSPFVILTAESSIVYFDSIGIFSVSFNNLHIIQLSTVFSGPSQYRQLYVCQGFEVDAFPSCSGSVHS